MNLSKATEMEIQMTGEQKQKRILTGILGDFGP